MVPSNASQPGPTSYPSRWNGARPKGSTPPVVLRSTTIGGSGNSSGSGSTLPTDLSSSGVNHVTRAAPGVPVVVAASANHVAAAQNLQTPLAVTAASNLDDLESIDYYPDVPGAPTLPLARAAGAAGPSPGMARKAAAAANPRAYIKYNSFANY